MTKGIIYTTLWLIGATLIYGTAALFPLYLLSFAYPSIIAIAALLPLCGFCFLFGVVLVTGLLKNLLPKLKPGSFSQNDPKFFIWLLHTWMRSYIGLPFEKFIYLFAPLRIIYFRLMGAHVHSSVDIFPSSEVHDPEMLNIGEGSLLGANVAVAGHIALRRDLWVLEEIHIGKKVRVGMFGRIPPGTTIGDRTRIAALVRMGPSVTIGADCKIGHHASLHQNCKIGDRVTIDNYVTVERYAVIEDDAKIGPNSVVPKRSCVKSGELFSNSPWHRERS